MQPCPRFLQEGHCRQASCLLLLTDPPRPASDQLIPCIRVLGLQYPVWFMWAWLVQCLPPPQNRERRAVYRGYVDPERSQRELGPKGQLPDTEEEVHRLPRAGNSASDCYV